MPFIHIKSLPLDSEIDVVAVLGGVSKDFSERIGIGIEHVAITWDYFQSRHYAVAGEIPEFQPITSHPILIELLAPDFNTAEVIEKMLECVASSFSSRTNVSRNNIFINYRKAHSGMVFDDGKLVKW